MAVDMSASPKVQAGQAQTGIRPFSNQLREPRVRPVNAKMWTEVDEKRVEEWENNQLQSVLPTAADVARFAEGDDLIFKAKVFLASEGGQLKPEMLTDDFVFTNPSVGQYGKQEYLEAVGGLYFHEAFPGANTDSHHFRVDPFDPYRVWFTQRARGAKHTEKEPQACSIRFDRNQRGKINQMTTGYAMYEVDGQTAPHALPSALKSSLERNFPGAMPGPAFQKKVVEALSHYGFTRENTILGTSFCPDEINSVKGTMSYNMQEYWGNRFPLGGIGGAPNVGKTGYFAFSHHVPDNGNVLVLFGPHVGITETGEVGKCLREGQGDDSSSCGACIAAYSQLKGGISEGGLAAKLLLDLDVLDIQQSMLRRAIAPHVERIDKADNPMAELAKVTYESIEKMMTEIAHTGFGPGYLALVGGIMINMPIGYPDYFMPAYFTIQKKQSGPEDILNKLKTPGFEFDLGSMSPAAASGDSSGYSPDQLAFMKRKEQER